MRVEGAAALVTGPAAASAGHTPGAGQPGCGQGLRSRARSRRGHRARRDARRPRHHRSRTRRQVAAAVRGRQPAGEQRRGGEAQHVTGAPNLDGARLEMETNYFGTLSMCRAFAPVLAANGGGAIVNMLSVTSCLHQPVRRLLRRVESRRPGR